VVLDPAAEVVELAALEVVVGAAEVVVVLADPPQPTTSTTRPVRSKPPRTLLTWLAFMIRILHPLPFLVAW